MNKHNLIQLGAFAQRLFCMQEGFKILEVSVDAPSLVRIALTDFRTHTDVTLKRYGTINMAYSRIANTLVIQEIQ